MRISDWSSDVCSSDLSKWSYGASANYKHEFDDGSEASARISFTHRDMAFSTDDNRGFLNAVEYLDAGITYEFRSEEHTSELQSLMRTSYDVFCLKKKKHKTLQQTNYKYMMNTKQQ